MMRPWIGLTLAVMAAVLMVCCKAQPLDSSGDGDETVRPVACDVLGAAACFQDLGGAPTPSQVAIDVQREIVQPCTKQTDKAVKMKTCLNTALADCMDEPIYTEIMAYVDFHTKFCTSVAACTDFVSKYTALVKCDNGFEDELRAAAAEGDEAKAAKCGELKTCLTDSSVGCDVFLMQAREEWDAYSSTCRTVNVTMEINVVGTDTALQTYCSNLDHKAKALNDCNAGYSESVERATWTGAAGSRSGSPGSSGGGLTALCTAYDDFDECAVEATGRCHTLADAYEVVQEDLTIITKPFCKTEKLCDFSGIAGCYQNFGASFWKVKDLVGDAKNMSVIYERLQQTTGAFRDVTALCNGIAGKEENIRSCLQEQLVGCPGEFDTEFIMRANFVKELCAEISACPAVPDLAAGVGECFSQADMALKALNKTDFQANFCRVFEDLAQCTHAVLAACPGDVMYVAGSWLQLKRDLGVMCPNLNLHMDNYTTQPIIEELVACDNLGDRATDITRCRAAFVSDISMQLTDTDEWCSSFQTFEPCLTAVGIKCPLLAVDLEMLVAETREKVAPQCSKEPEDSPETPGSPVGTDAGNTATRLTMSLVLILLPFLHM